MGIAEVLWVIVLIVSALIIRWIRILRLNSEQQIEQNKLIIEQLKEINRTLKNNEN